MLTPRVGRRGRVVVAVGVALLLLSACVDSGTAPAGPGGASANSTSSGSVAPAAGTGGSGPTTGAASTGWPGVAAVEAENALTGDPNWKKGTPDPPTTKVEGFTGRASVRPGEPAQLYVHSSDGPVTVKAFRIGWYGGAGARLVWTSSSVTQVTQPAPQFTAATRTWSAASWSPSLDLPTSDWPPGDYVLRLTATGGSTNLVPLTVRAPSTRGAVVIVNANTTWHAYNHWGGTSLYRGTKGFDDRAYAVSLDRPIDYGQGTGDYVGNEAALGQLAEKLGLPVAYVTDTDLHADAHLLDGATAVFSLGHDEYYSQNMRDVLVAARDTQATNLAFLGANAIYRHIRLDATPVGPNRLETDYKDANLDPMLRTNPAEATPQWRQPPVPRPESVITGVYYQCNPVKTDMVVAQADSWILAGTGLKNGDKLAKMVGSEYDQVTPSVPTPRPMQVLFHSPVTCRGTAQHSDAAYYTTKSGAGVFASGTSSWVCGLIYDCRFHDPDQHLVDVYTTMTTTLLKAFAAGPSAATHPAPDNLDQLGITAATARDITR